MTTLISGDFKLLVDHNGAAGWTGPVFPNSTNPNGGIDAIEHCGRGDGCLYSIINDPGERITKMPDKLKEMREKLSKYQATHFNPDRGEKDLAACDAALNDYGGLWGPYLK
jgi:arylsulfatase I/J